MTKYLRHPIYIQKLCESSFVFIVFLLVSVSLSAQVTISGGTGATTGSPDGSLTAAIIVINTGGALTSSVTVNVPAGSTENLTGRIVLTQTGTSTNTITIQRSRAGANPSLNAYTGTQ